jgi:hypothetical protein
VVLARGDHTSGSLITVSLHASGLGTFSPTPVTTLGKDSKLKPRHARIWKRENQRAVPLAARHGTGGYDGTEL